MFGAWGAFLFATNKWAQGQAGLLAYLWFSFAMLTGLGVGYLLIYRRQYQELFSARDSQLKQKRSINAAKTLSDQVAVLVHNMAETVRIAISRMPEKPKVLELEHVLGSGGLIAYAKKIFGDSEYRVVVKAIAGSETDRQLHYWFRDASCFGNQYRQKRDVVRVDESLVYETFARNKQAQQQVHLADVQELDDSQSAYKVVAEECSFRSVLAFPLRTPEMAREEGLELRPCIGFLSIDSPKPKAFSSHFDEKAPNWSTPKEGCNLDVFYALADSVACMVMLSKSSEGGERTDAQD